MEFVLIPLLIAVAVVFVNWMARSPNQKREEESSADSGGMFFIDGGGSSGDAPDSSGSACDGCGCDGGGGD